MGYESQSTALITTEDVSERLTLKTSKHQNTWLFDVSNLECLGRDSAREFEKIRIPGASFLALDALVDAILYLGNVQDIIVDTNKQANPIVPRLPEDLTSPLPPCPHVTPFDPVHDEFIVYDSFGLLTSPLAWFLLRASGFQHVRVLNGGLPKWVAEGRPTLSSPPQRRIDSQVSTELPEFVFDRSCLLSTEEVRRVVGDMRSGANPMCPTLWDARSTPSIVTTGMIAQAQHFPCLGLLEHPQVYSLKPCNIMKTRDLKEELAEIPEEDGSVSLFFRKMRCSDGILSHLSSVGLQPGLTRGKVVVSYCDVAYGAAMLLLALFAVGKPWEELKLYLGGFSAWESKKMATYNPLSRKQKQNSNCRRPANTNPNLQLTIVVTMVCFAAVLIWGVVNRNR
eukprot:Selendium_serpulae@DN5688_c0_g1_i1.p2